MEIFDDYIDQNSFKYLFDTISSDTFPWFYNNSKDFQEVCWSADMDPEMVRGEFMKLIKVGKIVFSKIQTHWLNYRKLYKLYREAGSKEERREIKKRIVKENLKRLQ